MEAYDFFGFLRMVVLGPLLYIKNQKPPRGVRKVETELQSEELKGLLSTMPSYERRGLLSSLRNAVNLYLQLRKTLYHGSISLRQETEKEVMIYFKEIENGNS